MEALQIAHAMEKAITALGKEGGLALGLIAAKATTMSMYDKDLAVAIIKLKDGGMAVSIAEKVAKGEVFMSLNAKIVAEESLKAHYSRMEQLKAQLNGLQSMNRYLDSV